MDPNWCLYFACKEGNLPAIEIARNLAGVGEAFGVFGALSGEHPELREQFRWRPTTELEHESYAKSACHGDNLVLAGESFEKMSSSRPRINSALRYAMRCRCNMLTVAELLSRGARFDEKCFRIACTRGNLRLAKVIYRALCEQSGTEVSATSGLKLACEHGHYDIAEFAIAHSDGLDECLCGVSKWSSAAVTRLLLRNGATKIDDAIVAAKKAGADNILSALEDARRELEDARRAHRAGRWWSACVIFFPVDHTRAARKKSRAASGQ